MCATEPLDPAFGTEAARAAAAEDRFYAWVSAYLSAPASRNPGLRDGLAAAPRWWLGPLALPLERLEPSHGPSPSMESPADHAAACAALTASPKGDAHGPARPH
ncbi:MAG: hypothetical protein ACFBRM_14790 [Pikeienuella sp.]